MTGQHVHDGRLPVLNFPAACGHFVKVKANDLRIPQIKACRFFQHHIGFGRIHKGRSGLFAYVFVIPVENALIQRDLCCNVRQHRYGVALRLNGFMNVAALK